MYGAILGDMIGSLFEFDEVTKSKEFTLFGRWSQYTDDARKQLENRLSYDWCQGRKTVALITE